VPVAIEAVDFQKRIGSLVNGRLKLAALQHTNSLFFRTMNHAPRGFNAPCREGCRRSAGMNAGGTTGLALATLAGSSRLTSEARADLRRHRRDAGRHHRHHQDVRLRRHRRNGHRRRRQNRDPAWGGLH